MLYRFGFVTSLRRARTDEIEDAKRFIHSKSHITPTHLASHPATALDRDAVCDGPMWDMDQVLKYMEDIGTKAAPCLMIVDGFVIDATSYMKEHVRCFAFVR